MSLARDAVERRYKIAILDASFPGTTTRTSWVAVSARAAARRWPRLRLHQRAAHVFRNQSRIPTHPQTLTFSGRRRRVGVHQPQAGGRHRRLHSELDRDRDPGRRHRDEPRPAARGRVYELRAVSAERHTPASNFNLTLDGFVNRPAAMPAALRRRHGRWAARPATTARTTAATAPAPRVPARSVTAATANATRITRPATTASTSRPTERDATRAARRVRAERLLRRRRSRRTAGEACDDGKNAGGYGQCGTGCNAGPRCGDGVVQARRRRSSATTATSSGGDGCTQRCQYELPRASRRP